MKHIIFALLVSTLFTSCVSTKHYHEMIDFYADSKKIEFVENSKLRITSPLSDSHVNKVEKTSSSFLPIIVYYASKDEFELEFNGNYRYKLVKQGILQKANKMNLEDVLGSKNILIKLESIPGHFQYVSQSGFIYVLYFIIDISENRIIQLKNDFVASYTVIDNGNEIYSKQVVFPGIFTEFIMPETSVNEFTYIFNLDYKRKLNNVGHKLLTEIVNDLEFKN